MFNLYDVVVLAVLLLSAYAGSRIGILLSCFYMVSGFAGLQAAQRFSDGASLKFYLIFAVTAAVVIGIGILLSKTFKKLFLGTIDRVSGAVLGLALGLVIVSTVLLPLSHHLPKKAHATVAASYTGRHLLPRLHTLFPLVEQFKMERIKDIFPKLDIPAKYQISLPGKTKNDAEK